MSKTIYVAGVKVGDDGVSTDAFVGTIEINAHEDGAEFDVNNPEHCGQLIQDCMYAEDHEVLGYIGDHEPSKEELERAEKVLDELYELTNNPLVRAMFPTRYIGARAIFRQFPEKANGELAQRLGDRATDTFNAENVHEGILTSMVA
jgi:hypothetical protein